MSYTTTIIRNRKGKGQTFPEMMIVVAIIAILAAVIIANLFHARGEARVSAVIETEQQISNAMESYFADYGVYPTVGSNVVNSDMFGGAGNPYYNSNPDTSSYQFPGNTNNITFQQWGGPAGCITSDPCNYGIWQWECSIDGSDIPASITQYDGSRPVKGTLYDIVYESPHGFAAVDSTTAGC